ncbi:MAG: hypothetical protein C4305_01900 [Thermoleophilia bacterium]
MVAGLAIGPGISATYYSRAISVFTPTSPTRSPRARARPRSLERPVNARLYRAAWLPAALAVLLLAFTTSRPQPLPPPSLPPTFDANRAATLARELASTYPDRPPGSPADLGAASWLAEELRALGLKVEIDTFSATIPGRGRAQLRNVMAVVPGRSTQTIVVLAHRDSTAGTAEANDNGSGTAALVELARAYGAPTAAPAPAEAGPDHTVVFLSTDGGAYGALGARRFARASSYAPEVVAAISLDAIASAGRPRLEIAGLGSRSPSPVLVATASARLREQIGTSPERASALAQLLDLAFPFSLYEQAPLLGRGIPAITITTGGARPREEGVGSAQLSTTRLAQVGRAAQSLLASLDAGVELARGTEGSWYMGSRLVQGWALRLLLVALLVPFLVAVVDLALRCRRHRVRLGPAVRSLRARVVFWLGVGVLFEIFALAGAFPQGASAPLNPASEAARHWPRLALAGYLVLVGLGWLALRRRLLRSRAVLPEDELAGAVAALLLLGTLSLLVPLVNTYLLLLLLPSLHAWLWLPQLRARPLALRGAVFLAGLAGPIVLLGSFASRFQIGLDTPWYLAASTAVGSISIELVIVFLTWVAAASQLLTIEAGRYRPSPSRRRQP